MRLGIWELLLIAAVIVLLFNGKRLARLFGAFRTSKTEFQRGLEEPVDVPFRDVSKDEEREKAERR